MLGLLGLAVKSLGRPLLRNVEFPFSSRHAAATARTSVSGKDRLCLAFLLAQENWFDLQSILHGHNEIVERHLVFSRVECRIENKEPSYHQACIPSVVVCFVAVK